MITQLQNCRFEILCDGEEFRGLGRIWIGDTLVRSGRLPLRPVTQAFPDALEIASLRLNNVEESPREIRIKLQALFRPCEVKMMRDHSFDPIHDTGDWDDFAIAGEGELEIVLQHAKDVFNDIAFAGFSYHYEYRSQSTPIFYLLDKASWELGGDIEGATVYSQSACSAPVVEFKSDTEWTTEGVIPGLKERGENPVMTHNLPRWASHGSFDFQFKGDQTLIGVFERVELIRSVLRREAGKAELKTFDKHIFDQAHEFTTSAKKILLNRDAKSVVTQQNLWTWVHCAVEERARREFGLEEEPLYPRLSVNFWSNFTVENYYQDLLPAAVELGFREYFIDNLKKSAMTEKSPLPGVFNWNMCCGHEYEISDSLGGVEGVKKLVEVSGERQIRPMSWTCNSQALSSPINASERDSKGWFVLLEDTRQMFGGAYASVMSVLDLGVAEAREYFVQSHIKIKEQTGLSGYLFDSFYNLAFMPVSYRDMKPRTMWRGLLQAVKELQDAGVHFLIESFGPFGTPQHGHPSSYNLDTAFICYRVGLGNDYSTVPAGNSLFAGHPDDAGAFYYALAHMAGGPVELFKNGKRIDEVWTVAHKQALADYHNSLKYLHLRILQEDSAGVLWHDASGRQATLFNFIERTVSLPGLVCDVTTGQELAPAKSYTLQPLHTYAFMDAVLPTQITSL
jgi:hypothetical protein